MSYQFLGLLQKEAGKLRQERQQALEPLLHQGLEFLSRAEQTGFRDPGLLSQAADCFLRAEQADRQDIRPCLFLAYIFMLLKDLHRANLFINEARRHDAKHPLVQQFGQKLSELHQLKPQSGPAAPVATHLQDFPEDPELMYEAIEKEIMAQLREIQQMPPPPAHAAPEAIDAFAHQLELFRQHLTRLQAGLRELDQQIDTLALKTRLRPFEVMLHRHTAHLKRLQEARQIIADTTALRIEVGHSLNRLSQGGMSDKAAYEAQLEAFLDRLDALADRIDAQEAQGQSTTQLEESYSWVMHLLEDYRDHLDGLDAA